MIKNFRLKIANRKNTFKLKYLTLFFLLWIYYVYIYQDYFYKYILYDIYLVLTKDLIFGDCCVGEAECIVRITPYLSELLINCLVICGSKPGP